MAQPPGYIFIRIFATSNVSVASDRDVVDACFAGQIDAVGIFAVVHHDIDGMFRGALSPDTGTIQVVDGNI